MKGDLFLGIDIGTGSSKAVVVGADGLIVHSAVVRHETSMPHAGWFEHDAEAIWWGDAAALIRDVVGHVGSDRIASLGVSGIGPCALVTDAHDRPLRPAILYGIDTRAEPDIADLTREIGEAALLAQCGNVLTSQSVGPKLRWIARNEPRVWAEARRWFSASNYVVFRLTGEYAIDHYTASGSDPLYDLQVLDWWDAGWAASSPALARPMIAWPGDIVGQVSPNAAWETGLRAGTPVIAGTIDAFAEGFSVGCRDVGDTMIMYGSTLFMIQTVEQPITDPRLWALAGRVRGTYELAAGMATSGLITNWFAEAVERDIPTLLAEARSVPAGSDGLVLLPYFAGERTPLFDPDARGVWVGLSLTHRRAHLYRSILEGVAFGVRHNLETMAAAGAPPRRLVAVGGGTGGDLWMQIVSDVTGMRQEVPTLTIGASYGDARMAAEACSVGTNDWNPVASVVAPGGGGARIYEELYRIYRSTYPQLRQQMSALSQIQRRAG